MVFIFLSVYIYLDSRHYSCDSCRIIFKSKPPQFTGIDYMEEANTSAYNIQYSLNKNQCIIRWDEVNGFYRDFYG